MIIVKDDDNDLVHEHLFFTKGHCKVDCMTWPAEKENSCKKILPGIRLLQNYCRKVNCPVTLPLKMWLPRMHLPWMLYSTNDELKPIPTRSTGVK